jgi:hypothetical protein
MLDTLDTLIAFVTVTLVLSLLVTGLVQMIQYAIGQRGRNLELGLAGLLASLTDPEAVRAGGAQAVRVEGQARELARTVVHDPRLTQPSNGVLFRWLSRRLAKLRHRRFVGKPAGWLYWSLLGRTTWIERGELRSVLGELLEKRPAADGEVTTAEVATAKVATAEVAASSAARLDDELFDRWERNLSKRFQHRMRWLTAVCAFVVVILFQVDGFKLLRDLSADAELRSRIAGLSSEALGQESGVREMLDLRGAAEEALDRFEARHPEIEALLEEASGVGPDRASIVAELEAVLADRPPVERDALLAEYSALLDGVIGERQRRARALVEDALGMSARMGLEPWPRGLGFYVPMRLGRWLGVGVMVFLVSFGAPFWFNTLRNLVGLRDLLKPKEKEAKTPAAPARPPAPAAGG